MTLRSTPITDFKDFRLLVEVQGPFVSTGVLRATFPQGFPKEETLSDDLRRLRLAYEAWQDASPFDLAAQNDWVRFVFAEILEFEGNSIATGQAIPQSLHLQVAEARMEITPDILITSPGEEDLLGNTSQPQPLIPVFSFPRDHKLEKPFTMQESAAHGKHPGRSLRRVVFSKGQARQLHDRDILRQANLSERLNS